MDATAATQNGVAELALEEIPATIERIDPRRESENGNAYTLIVTSTADWVYVWNNAWRRELQRWYSLYYGLDAVLYVRDHSDPGEEKPFYWLEAAVPQSRKLLHRFLER